jgi:hypothetical protein
MRDIRHPSTSESEFALRRLHNLCAMFEWPAAGLAPYEIERAIDGIVPLFELSTGIEKECFRDGAREFFLSCNSEVAAGSIAWTAASRTMEPGRF